MKTGDFTPKPGDLFTWYWSSNDKLCDLYDCVSYNPDDNTQPSYNIPCHGINFLISITDTDMWWINGCLLGHCRVRYMAIHPRIGHYPHIT